MNKSVSNFECTNLTKPDVNREYAVITTRYIIAKLSFIKANHSSEENYRHPSQTFDMYNDHCLTE